MTVPLASPTGTDTTFRLISTFGPFHDGIDRSNPAPTDLRVNRRLALCCLLGIALFSACAPLKPPPGKGIFWAPSAPIELPLALGYTGLRRGRVSRDSTGDHLFLQYYDSARQDKVFVVSADGIQIKNLPGPSAFDAEANAVWWLTDSWRFEFANGYVTPTN